MGHWGFAVVNVRDNAIKFYDSIKNCDVDFNGGHCVCNDVRSFLRTTNFISKIITLSQFYEKTK